MLITFQRTGSSRIGRRTAGSPSEPIYLSCGDSAHTGLPPQSVDLVVTDPPFFDNVHYSELADFFLAWQQLSPNAIPGQSLDDAQPARSPGLRRRPFRRQASRRLCRVPPPSQRQRPARFHLPSFPQRRAGRPLADAMLGAGFTVVNSQPVKAEMSVATPKSQAKDPIQLDIILVCRKQTVAHISRPSMSQATESAKAKITRLLTAGFQLSHNDRKIVLFGQLLTTLRSPDDMEQIARHAEIQLDDVKADRFAAKPGTQAMLFE